MTGLLPLEAGHGSLVKRAYLACSKLTGIYRRAQGAEAAFGAENPLCFVQFVAAHWCQRITMTKSGTCQPHRSRHAARRDKVEAGAFSSIREAAPVPRVGLANPTASADTASLPADRPSARAAIGHLFDACRRARGGG